MRPFPALLTFLTSFGDALRLQARAIAIVARAAPRVFAAYVAVAAFTSTLPVTQVWLGKRIVDSLATGTSGALTLVALYLVVLGLDSALTRVRQPLMGWLEQRSIAAFERRIMEASGRLPDLYRIERPAFLDEVELLSQTAYRAGHRMSTLETLFSSVFVIAGLLVLLASLHPLVPAALVLLLVPHLATTRQHSKLVHDSMASRSRAGREMDYCLRTVLEPATAKELRVFGLSDFFRARFRERLDAALAEVRRLRVRALGITTLYGGLYACALAGSFWYVAAQAGAGALTIGDVVLYLGAVQQAQIRSASLAAWFGQHHESALYLRGFFRFLDEAGPTIALPPRDRALPVPERFGFELRDVRFAYPEHPGQPVLDGVTATLPAGQVTAIVGANGAGKSTLVKLLTRLYDPTSGEILLNGLPLAAYDLHDLRRHTAVVYQDFARFSFTLRENVAVGLAAYDGHANGATNGHDEAIDHALRQSGADEVAARLPQGVDTLLTRRYHGGIDLSGGEWQKVALARAFVRSPIPAGEGQGEGSASLIVLDEPTAALDAAAEYQLFERFRELVKGKTALLISHRFSTVRMADHILVLENGHIVEAGSHAVLVAQQGRYAQLYEMQAGRYR